MAAPSAMPKAAVAAKRFMMVRPTHFTVSYSINPWMNASNPVDRTKAMQQWNTLKETLESVGGEINVMESNDAPNLPDIVFSANAAVLRNGKAYLANFHNKERQGERAHYKKWFEKNGYKTCGTTELAFEGAGDALWAGKDWNKLFVGVGPRTAVGVLPLLSEEFADGTQLQVIGCHLIDQRFYHIDTAFCPLNEELAMYYPDAFDQMTLHNIKNHGVDLFPVTEKEASNFACNAVVVGKNVVMHKNNDSMAVKLERLGYTAHFVDMSEFIKSGGSAKCCTIQLF